jgi:hypothetical protein
MDQAEAKTLLTYIAAIDHRNIDFDAEAMIWADLLDDIPLTPARAAVREYYRQESRWITPAEIRRRALATRAEATRRPAAPGPEAVPDADPDDVREYLRAVAEGRWRQLDPTARPRPVGELLAGYGAVTVIPPEEPAVTGALAVPCPMRSCNAKIGEPCRSLFGRERAPHPVRGRAPG